MHEQRELAYGNLAAAIKKLTEAQWYLETVEPKPPFYPDVVTLRRDAKEAQDTKHDNHNFTAARAIRMSEWEDAARELRIIRELVPDRGDPRNKEATKKLIDVERRIKTSK